MTRVSGFLVGIGLTVAALFAVLDPDGTWRDETITAEDAGATSGPPGAAIVASGAGVAPVPPDAGGLAAPATEPPPGTGPETQPEPTSVDEPATTAEPVTVQDPVPTDVNLELRHLIWSPFHSEWAARGFAGRLRMATDVPVVVVEVGQGLYRVGFSYRDEAELRERISRIEDVTGLDLEGP
jgi:hypothetical protein